MRSAPTFTDVGAGGEDEGRGHHELLANRLNGREAGMAWDTKVKRIEYIFCV